MANLPNSYAATGQSLPPRRDSSSSSSSSTPGGTKGTGELVRQSNRWRDNYNPLRNLVISRVVTILEAAERGDYAELQLVMRKIERRYPILKALKARRLAALEKLDWDIRVVDELPAGYTEAQAEKQKEFLRARYEQITNLTEAFGFLVTPEFRGYAILQKHRATGGEQDGAVTELHWLPQDQFCRDGQFGDWFYNKDSRFGVGLDSCKASLGEANRIGSAQLPREDFVIRELDSPLYEIALTAFVNWSMGRKDWSAFVEIFGLPKGVVIMPANIPAGQEADYQAAAEKVSDGVAGALPATSDIKFPTTSLGNNAPFKEFCDSQDADVVLAGTGGRLSMLTADKGGLGDGPSDEHADAFDEIAQADARKINAVLQADFDKLELAEAFPGQPCLAYFELCAVEQEDATEVIAQITGLKNVGYKVSEEQVEEKTGYDLEEIEEQPKERGSFEDEPQQPEQQNAQSAAAAGRADTAALRNRDSQPSTSNPQLAFASTVAEKLDPIAAMLNRITQMQDDAAMQAALQQFLTHADALAHLVTADVRRQASALEQVITPAFSQSLKS